MGFVSLSPVQLKSKYPAKDKRPEPILRKAACSQTFFEKVNSEMKEEV